MKSSVNRTIRPSSRISSSPYRVSIEKKDLSEGLIVNITHENLPFRESYLFREADLKGYKSIHFNAIETNGVVKVEWVQNIPFELEKHQ